jgi:uncharacterized protein
MTAVDTNILVYSHRADSAFYRKAFDALKNLAESKNPWAIPWPSIHEFLAIVTHPKIYSPPTPLNNALDQIQSWMECPALTLIGESGDIYFNYLKHTLEASHASGPKIHDARIAAICLLHGIDVLWTADRDFSRFPGLTVKNPIL